MLPDLAPAPIPRLSVIVPIFNVAAYLPACLDSLAAQRLIAIEVVMVDDGSTDESAEIAAEYESRDPRFRLVRQENGGLGCARNTGVRAASPSSTYLAFVDSDDLVPPDAYAAMVASLDETGSDFATGNVHHVDSHRRWQTSMFRMLAARSRRRTHISRFRELVADRIACNKVYRRSFWNQHGFVFPEGVLYEDIPVTLPAHYLARAVDALSAPVYYWRVRDGGDAPSITHRRTEPGACRDRVNAVESVSRFLAGRPGRTWAEHKRHYDRSALTMDLRTFLRVLPEGDERYHQEFLLHANRFLDHVHPGVLRDLPLDLRVQWALVRRRALPELLATLTADRLHHPVRVRGRWLRHAHFPELTTPARLPWTARRLRRQDLRFHTPVRELTWHRGTLRISGDAWINRVDAPTRLSHAKVAQLRQVGSRRRIVLPVSQRFRPERTAESGGHAHCYDWAGYELVVDPERLKRRGRWEEGTWLLGVGVLAPGIARVGSLTVPGGGHPAGYPPYHWVDEDVRVVVGVVRRKLALRVERVRALVTGHGWDGDRLEIQGELRAPLRHGERLTLRLTAMGDGEIRDYPVEPAGDSATFTVRVPAADLRPTPRHVSGGEWAGFDPWSEFGGPEGPGAQDDGENGGNDHPDDRRGWSTALLATRSDGTVRQFSTVVREGVRDAEFRLPPEGGRPAELAAVAGHNGYLKLWVRRPQAVLASVRWTAGRLLVSGRTTAELVPGAARLVLRAVGRPEERRLGLTRCTAGTFEAEFSPSALPGPAGTLPLRNGEWDLLLRPGTAVGPEYRSPRGGGPGDGAGEESGDGTPTTADGAPAGTAGAPATGDDAPEAGATERTSREPIAREHDSPEHASPEHASREQADLGVKIDRLAAPGVGRPVDSGGRRYQLRVHSSDRPRLWCHSELSPLERGNYRQRQLLDEVYRPMRRMPLRDAVLYLSYNGKQCSDSPLAIQEELLRRDGRFQHLWVVRDGQAQVPPGTRAVPLWSRAWFEALASSRFVVTNAHLPDWLERRPGQVVVQTWHGTMLKRIGLDIEQPRFDRDYHERIRRDTRNWSLLVSANRFSTPILRRAFDFHGEIIEAGYPRNDRLYATDRKERAARLAERLGLPPGRRVVLYAPTWRDDQGQGRGDYRLDLRLDLAEAERRLGDDHVLLIRRHSHVADQIPGDGQGFLWDVSEYPEVADLYLVADVLVTDYSSVMFDFAHTRRPMLFFTYDLEHYRDTLRGFYFDFEREAPGPLLRTSGELIDALADLDRVTAEHRENYDRFVERFCDLDDGGAAGRVVDRMLELGAETPGSSAPVRPTDRATAAGTGHAPGTGTTPHADAPRSPDAAPGPDAASGPTGARRPTQAGGPSDATGEPTLP